MKFPSFCPLFSFSGVPYQLDQLANNQPRVSDFFAPRKSWISKGASGSAAELAMSEADNSSLNDSTLEGAELSELNESVRHERLSRGETELLLEDVDSRKVIELPSCATGKSHEVNVAELSSSSMENESESIENYEFKLPPLEHMAPLTSHSFDDKNLEPRSSEVIGNCKMPHSTLGDPNFVENYFKVMFWNGCDVLASLLN